MINRLDNRQAVPDQDQRQGPRRSRRAPPERTVYVSSIPYAASCGDLLAFCQGLGLQPGTASVLMDDEGKSRGVAFIDFPTPEERDRALELLNGAELGGRRLLAAPPRRSR